MFAGSRMLTIADDGGSFRTWVLYPTTVAAAPVAFGPYAAEVSPDAPVAEGRFPVVAISHGSGGSPFVYRGLAAYLARHGFVVVLPEHPGNNRNDNRAAVIGHSRGGYTALALAGGRPWSRAGEPPRRSPSMSASTTAPRRQPTPAWWQTRSPTQPR